MADSHCPILHSMGVSDNSTGIRMVWDGCEVTDKRIADICTNCILKDKCYLDMSYKEKRKYNREVK